MQRYRHQEAGNNSLFEKIDKIKQTGQIETYASVLFDYSKRTNLISKRILKKDIYKLIDETLLLAKIVNCEKVFDVGSGNGLLGIPLAINNPQKEIALIEPRQKKSEFLRHVKSELHLSNVTIWSEGVESFIKREQGSFSLLARGFPNNTLLYKVFKIYRAKQLVLVSSYEKVKKIIDQIETNLISVYNIPERDIIKIFCLESVSRETL